MLDGGFDVVRSLPGALSLGSAPRRLEARSDLRELAATADASQARPVLLSTLWAELTSASYSSLATFTNQQRHYLVLEERERPQRAAGHERDVDVLRRILVDGCQKVAAYDLTLAPSSISFLGKRAFSSMGFSGPVAQAPLLLFLAARAVTCGNSETARVSIVRTEERTLHVLSVARPDLHLERALSPALADVASQLIAGKRRSEIARFRRTSVRTVSNQLRAVFASLNATGRLSLLAALPPGEGGAAPVTGCRES